MELKKLKETMPYQWRVQSFSKTTESCACVAYIDARDVMDKLDEVCSPENWQDKYEVVNGQLFCSIGIYDVNSKQWVWKSDTGTESQTEKEKGHVSDAFKRAAVKWGVGRFLYSLEIQHIKSNAKKDASNYPFPIDDYGKRIWDVSKFINEKMKSPAKKAEPKPKPYLNENSDEFQKAVIFLKGEGTIKKIKAKYNLSDSVEKALTDAVLL